MRAFTMLLWATFHGFLYVGLSAFAAHGLQGVLNPKQQHWFDTAASYQIVHALALLGLGLWALQIADTQKLRLKTGVVAWFFIVGIALFSGSLYLMALGAPTWLAMATPLGGLCLLFGWLIWFFLLLKAARTL